MSAIISLRDKFSRAAELAVARAGKITERLQFRFILGFVLILAVLLICLNTIPLIYFRDVVISEKERALTAKASVISSALAPLDELGTGGVSQVLGILDIQETSRVLVTDEECRIVYDTYSSSETGNYALFSELAWALDGSSVFLCRYERGLFTSQAAMPVRTADKTIGAVYIAELDHDQASMILSIQDKLAIISIVACAAALLLVIVFSRAFTARITNLSKAIQVVRDGNYSHRIAMTGNDELTELGGEFNELTLRLQTTEEQRRRFVSDASHELKTPLAAIRLLSDSILQSSDIDDATMREFVGDIGTEAERLQHMSEDLLALSRHDDRIDEERVFVDIGTVAASTLKMLGLLAKPKGIALRLQADKNCVVLASEGNIYQIIFNLAENAIKYNVEGGSVDIAVKHRGEDILLIVEDTGVGIPDEDKPLIFQRFYRVDKARSREGGGSGLGLSIVYEAVVSIGGEISVEDSLGGGTRFVVRIPVAYPGKGAAK